MARFFFSLYERGSVLVDEEGADLPDAAAAYANAVREARHLMATDVLRGDIDLASYIQVLDENRQRLFVVAFRDAVFLH